MVPSPLTRRRIESIARPATSAGSGTSPSSRKSCASRGSDRSREGSERFSGCRRHAFGATPRVDCYSPVTEPTGWSSQLLATARSPTGAGSYAGRRGHPRRRAGVAVPGPAVGASDQRRVLCRVARFRPTAGPSRPGLPPRPLRPSGPSTRGGHRGGRPTGQRAGSSGGVAYGWPAPPSPRSCS